MPKRVEEVRLRTERVREAKVSLSLSLSVVPVEGSAGVGGLDESDVEVGVRENGRWGWGRRSWWGSSLVMLVDSAAEEVSWVVSGRVWYRFPVRYVYDYLYAGQGI